MEHIVKSWAEANDKLREITSNQYTLGSGHNYPRPFAAFHKDALSGEGYGYRIYTTKDKELDSFIATVSIK